MLNRSQVMYRYRKDEPYSLKYSHWYFVNAVVNVRNDVNY